MTPPPELVQQWWEETQTEKPERWVGHLANQAVQWGFNQRGAVNKAELQKARDEELDACCKAFEDIWDQEDVATLTDFLRGIRAARRPKPKSQAEEALNALDDAMIGGHIITTSSAAPTIRAALERLRELEQSDG